MTASGPFHGGSPERSGHRHPGPTPRASTHPELRCPGTEVMSSLLARAREAAVLPLDQGAWPCTVPPGWAPPLDSPQLARPSSQDLSQTHPGLLGTGALGLHPPPSTLHLCSTLLPAPLWAPCPKTSPGHPFPTKAAPNPPGWTPHSAAPSHQPHQLTFVLYFGRICTPGPGVGGGLWAVDDYEHGHSPERWWALQMLLSTDTRTVPVPRAARELCQAGTQISSDQILV